MKKDDFLKIMRNNAKTALTEQEENYFGSIGQAVEEAFTAEAVERNKKLTDISNLLGQFDEGKTASGIIRGLAAKVDELEAKMTTRLSEGDKNKIRRALEAKKDEINAIRRKQTNTPWELQFSIKRAASAMMQTSTVVTGAVADNNPNQFEDFEIEVIRYPKNFILDAISSRQVSKVPERWGWKEQITAGTGAAAAVSEGNAKPLVDFKFEWKYVNRKKYAGRIEMTEEVEIDFEQLMLDIIDMFETEVLRAYNAGILTDILAWAPAYTATALDGTIVKPTLMNVISAGQLQLAGSEYRGDVLVINPSDYAATQNIQNKNGDPIFIPDNVLFPGVTLFVTNNITAGTALLGEGSIVKEQHSGFILRQGTYGNQFIENEKTIVGELFSCLKLPTESKKGWVKLDIATVTAALLKTNNTQ
jgi:HK97 family phage major capsid protein